MVEVAGVEPALFTTRERIYSPLQNTPYLQCLHIETHFGYCTKQKLSITVETIEMCFYMVGVQRIEL